MIRDSFGGKRSIPTSLLSWLLQLIVYTNIKITVRGITALLYEFAVKQLNKKHDLKVKKLLPTTVPCAQTYSFESVIRGHHVFISIWSPFVSETLDVKQEKGNRHVRFAVAVLRRQSQTAAVTTILGRIPREFSQL